MNVAEIEAFFDRTLTGRVRGHVLMGGREYEYLQWDGESLDSRLVALDTETAKIESSEIPNLAVAQAYDGQTCYLIHPDDLGRFIQQHRKGNFVGHNIAGFDFLVIDRHLKRLGDKKARKVWMKAADQGRLADTMLLDQLVHIGRGSSNPRERDLGQVALHWANIADLAKDDPWRLKFGEIINTDWLTVHRDAWNYAAKDPIATRLVFYSLRDAARQLAESNKIDPATIQQYGLLSQRLQVRAAIALAAIHHRGIHIDRARREEAEQRLRTEIADLLQTLDSMPELVGVFPKDIDGNIVLTPTGKPKMAQKRLRWILESIADEHAIVPDRSPKTGLVTLRRMFWEQHKEVAPFIGAWTKLEETSKLVQFFDKLQSERTHPRYMTLTRTGRTACRRPNLQQMPRSKDFREIFIPSPGYVFLTIDFAAVELRTLAAECERRFGKSVLADVIRKGIDPHAHTASMLMNMNLDDFLQLKESDPAQYKARRQQAKAVNFGVPGGLGPISLSQYAKLSFGVNLDENDAGEFRDRFLHTIYPEIGTYMNSDLAEILAENLCVSLCRVSREWPNVGLISGLKNVVQGRTTKRDGTPYDEDFVKHSWEKLRKLNKNPELTERLRREQAGLELERDLFFGTVSTVTGRPRGRANFTQRKNTPFQAAAADGAKIALWKLHRAGYRIAAFVHDEFVIELPVDCDHTAEAHRIDKICCRSMAQVTGTVPVACEYTLSDCWSKQAKAVRDAQGQLTVWSPNRDIWPMGDPAT